MGEHIVARDLMVHEVGGIRGDQTLGEAMQALVDLQTDKEVPNALVVLDEDGNYDGLLTARLLCKSLAARTTPGENADKGTDKSTHKSTPESTAPPTKEQLELVRKRSQMRVHDALNRDLPTVAPGDRLLSLIRLASEKRPEYLPVVDNGHVRGLVPVTRIFLAAASLALTPEHEGIRFDQDTRKPRP